MRVIIAGSRNIESMPTIRDAMKCAIEAENIIPTAKFNNGTEPPRRQREERKHG